MFDWPTNFRLMFNSPTTPSSVCFLGDLCAEDIDECLEDNPCHNRANCTNSPGNYTCDCSLGYEGRDCQIADCSVGQCQNGATCRVDENPNQRGVQVWKCDCVQHYEGEERRFLHCLSYYSFIYIFI